MTRHFRIGRKVSTHLICNRYKKLEFKTRFTSKWFHDIIISINNEFVEPFLVLWRYRNDGKEKITNWNREF